ncbi:hypothetical protein AB0C10_37435 [Microbispora amethystogenes]|uniref:hypothetical protein n=1 Tax=Microbispora amethystogenes TaxID=1427754 RepID=UPI0033FE0580
MTGDREELLARADRAETAARHLGEALNAWGELVRHAVHIYDAGDPKTAMQEIAAYAADAGILDELEPAGSPS